MSNELVVIQVQKYHETNDAILVGPPGTPGRNTVQDKLKVWLPLGLITHSEEFADDIYELEIPRWLMEKKSLEDFETEQQG